MAIDLKGRKVQRFRAHIDPMIGSMPRNAFDVKAHNIEAELTPAGIYVKVRKTANRPEEEHIVPYSNVQSVKLIAKEEDEEKEEKEEKKAA